jgi:hypothetical protein
MFFRFATIDAGTMVVVEVTVKIPTVIPAKAGIQ